MGVVAILEYQVQLCMLLLSQPVALRAPALHAVLGHPL
jgi:hypothetical protein